MTVVTTALANFKIILINVKSIQIFLFLLWNAWKVSSVSKVLQVKTGVAFNPFDLKCNTLAF